MKKILLLSAIMMALSNANAFAVDVYDVPGTYPTFEFNIYNQGETVINSDNEPITSVFTMNENQLDALFDAAKSWDNILNTVIDPNKLPIFAITTDNDFNASAISDYVPITGSDYLITEINAFVNNKTIVGEYSDIHGYITVGIGLIEDHPGWNYYTGSTALYQANLPDLYSTMFHEIYHAIGLSSNSAQYIPDDKTYYFSEDASSPISIWDAGLRIYTNKMNKPFDANKIIAAEPGMSIKTKLWGEGTFDLKNYAPYFAGIETLKVLTGLDDTEENMQEYIHFKGGLKNYSKYVVSDPWIESKVLGLPVNSIEGTRPELSHIELRNSFMSHQNYQNWAILMEAELAVLKDLGYTNVDTRRFFGKSYYLDDITDTFSTGYGEWDGSSYSGYSTIANGIGLHIYGNNNIITQTGDTLSKGKYTIGSRIDGTDNIYTLNNSLIDVTGDDSIGIAVAWGKGHTVNIDSTSTVNASGKDSIGVSFDFGKNVIGGYDDDRGSFSRYDSDLKENRTPVKETQGALVENFNVDGVVGGTKAAIYVSENAFVKNININNNSYIDGNIISNWNSVKSGINMAVMRQGTDSKWHPVDKEKIEQIYFTNLNFSGDTDVNGNIDGSNDIFNTLLMNNTGNLNFRGDDLLVYHLKNNGTIDFSNMENTPELIIQDGSISGSGTINFKNGINLGSISNIENTVDVGNTFISLMDEKANKINISKLNSNNADLYIDYGDSFILQNASDSGLNKMDLKQIYVDKAHADSIDEADSLKLFEETSPTAIVTNTLDVTSSANFYYNRNKYTLSQDATDKSYLSILKTEGNYELADALADTTTANYIVSEDDVVTKDLGTVQSGNFEISGDEIDLDGHSGLVVNGTINKKTVLKTDIYGASDSNITLLNKANMFVTGEDGITIGEKGETSITIDDSTFETDLGEENLNIGGKIKGLNINTDNKVILSAKNINLDSVDNVAIGTKAETINLNNTMTNAIWQVSGTNINILNDSYLSSNGTNNLIYNGGLLNLANNRASAINLASMTLNNDMKTNIDVDLGTLRADRFVFGDVGDLVTNDNDLFINNINFLNTNSILTEETYLIPFISSDYNNTNLLGHVNYNKPTIFTTPIFKYAFNYSETETQGGFALARGSSSDYRSYNPSVLASPAATQVGGYLTQINSYDEAFYNMDMNMLMTNEQRQALKFKNKYAASDSGLVYDSTILRQERAEGWFRPYATFEKVGLKNGPNVESQAYGAYFGGESKLFDLGHGWDGLWGAYVGYNGSHQNFNGVSIYQNGGTLGLSGTAYKGNFFTGLTVNAGAGAGNAHTMYGNEDFAMFMTGVASKTGYNWELAKGKFIIQPSWLMSYSFVNTFNYTNAAGVKINTDPLHAIQLQPGIKFIGNLKNGWQPYASVSMVWNILDKTRFKANDVSMPEMSVKPYVKYGVGIRKLWGEKFTGFFQVYMTNGGRNGVGLSTGFTWVLGKDEKKK